MGREETGRLFEEPDDSPAETFAPLAERMRPRTLDEFVGQAHLVGPGTPLRRFAERGGRLPSLILWGAPGTGKTTLARVLARHARGEGQPGEYPRLGFLVAERVAGGAEGGPQLGAADLVGPLPADVDVVAAGVVRADHERGQGTLRKNVPAAVSPRAMGESHLSRPASPVAIARTAGVCFTGHFVSR